MDATVVEGATVVAHLDDLAEGSMMMVRAEGRRICLVRTASGVHALDNACPHEGYGLAQGGLDGELVTCQWHNWKFRVADGGCVQGEEAVRVHDVIVDDDGAVRVTVNRPDPAALVPQLMTSLRSAIAKEYIGQVSRDVIRLLKAGADPAELVWAAVEFGAPREEDGWGHAIASATDCLAMLSLHDRDEQAFPVVQAIAGIAEVSRDRHVRELPPPATPDESTAEAFRAAMEREDVEGAQALLLGALRRGAGPVGPGGLIRWFTEAVSDHHLSYGHGAIYSQKAFELLEVVGWHRADVVLGHLVPTLVYGTREDLLPYMRPFTRPLATFDLDALASSAVADSWDGVDGLVTVLLGSDRSEPARAVAAALANGAGIARVLDACVLASSERMLRYDVTGEFHFSDDFGWLDITHGLTYAHAVRWHHRQSVEAKIGTTADLVRLAMYCAFLANWTGRHEWHTVVGEPAVVDLDGDIAAAGAELQRQSLLDGTSAQIVAAHAVKTSMAATRESLHLGSPIPLQAAKRFIESPKLERFVARTVQVSLDFLNGRTQRD